MLALSGIVVFLFVRGRLKPLMQLRTAAERIAAFFIAHIRPDGLTDCDFLQPKAPERIDNIAGACGACGRLDRAGLTGEARYREAAERLLDGLMALSQGNYNRNLRLQAAEATEQLPELLMDKHKGVI